MDIPIQLPSGWSLEWAAPRVAIIRAPGPYFITVDERLRNFALGHGPVYDSAYDYTGRGWRKRLYRDAIEELRRAINE